MFNQLRKGNQVEGRYLGVQYTGTVRSVRLNEGTRSTEVEIDFPASLSGFRGRDWDVRTGLILTGVGEDEYVRVAA